jgi:mono/diheme cytochrome c family protein
MSRSSVVVMKRASAALMIGLSAFLAGCGSSSSAPRPNGAALFAASCSSCHSLIGNESRHTQGGDLLGYGFSRPVLVQLSSEMPLRRMLTGAQLRAVVDYVLHAERQAATRR